MTLTRRGLLKSGIAVAATTANAEAAGPTAPIADPRSNKGYGLDKMTFQELEVLAQSSLLVTEDFREGATALAQRREPRFKGR